MPDGQKAIEEREKVRGGYETMTKGELPMDPELNPSRAVKTRTYDAAPTSTAELPPADLMSRRTLSLVTLIMISSLCKL